MVPDKPAHLENELLRRVTLRTGQRVRNLAVAMAPDGVVLSGRAPSYHVKQLAQQGIRDLLPHVQLRNVILVEAG